MRPSAPGSDHLRTVSVDTDRGTTIAAANVAHRASSACESIGQAVVALRKRADVDQSIFSGRGYSQRNTFADSAVQIAKMTISAKMSPMCADHASFFQIPWSRDTA